MQNQLLKVINSFILTELSNRGESFLTLTEIFLYLLSTNSAERLLRPKEACQLLSISYSTLLRWIREGKIRVVMTEGGKYRIPYSEIKKYLESREETRAVIYARVSSADQKEDLERQINYLTNYATAKGHKVVEVVKDIASGLTHKEKDC